MERSSIRYSPSGLPLIDCVLSHQGSVTHEGGTRQVSLQVRALAAGSWAHEVTQLNLGELRMFSGFVAPFRNGKGFLFHITGMTPLA